MLEDVRAEAHVDGAVGERQPHPAPEHRAAGRLVQRGHLAGVGVEAGVAGAGAGEGVVEVTRASPDVEHRRAVQLGVAAAASAPCRRPGSGRTGPGRTARPGTPSTAESSAPDRFGKGVARGRTLPPCDHRGPTRRRQPRTGPDLPVSSIIAGPAWPRVARETWLRRNGTGAARRRRVVICSWRDETHPEAGGSERYVGQVARYLASQGDDVARAHLRPRRRAARRGRRRRPLPPPRRPPVRLRAGRVAPALRPGRRRPRRPERHPVRCPAGHPRAGRRARAPRPPRAVARRPAARSRQDRLVRRVPGGAAAAARVPLRRRLATTPRGELASLGVRREDVTVVHNGRDDPLGQWPPRRPADAVRRGPAGPAQARRACGRGGAAAGRGARPPAARRRRRAVGRRAAPARRTPPGSTTGCTCTATSTSWTSTG